MRLTEAAAARIREIMADAEGQYEGVRVGVTNGGCAGMSYTMDYAEQAEPLDEVVEDQGVKILIDPKAIMFLLGTEMDFVTEKFGARFVFNNPNQTERLRLRRERGDHAGAATTPSDGWAANNRGGVDNQVSGVRPRTDRDDADRCLPVFL